MKMQDINGALKIEVKHWFNAQVRNPYSDYYLYYIESNKMHNGGFVIMSDVPANSEYKRAENAKLRKDSTIEQNYNMLRDVVNRLPILDI